jgi:2-phosphosulfolactate phosphatase
VAVDVIRASTSAITAVANGGRCFPVTTVEEAFRRAAQLRTAWLVGEIGGNMPYGFDLTNSPAEIEALTEKSRPVVLLSSSGTRLMSRLSRNGPAYIACFRNFASTAKCLSLRHDNVAVVGAGTRGEFREEDQMCCAWIAEGLMAAGYEPEDDQTAKLVAAWSGAPRDAFLGSNSVKYLRNTAQEHDLDFILSHFEDLDAAFTIMRGEVVKVPEISAATDSAENRLRRWNGFAPTKAQPEWI